ncbi:MAG: hypothetical protein ACE5EQ_11355 [Phycisphaerae bacterium]
MMKWLRIHTKQIMVAVVLLAMFSFVGGPSLVNILAGNPAATVVMKVFDREVTQGELSVAQGEADALRNLLMNWKYDLDGEMNIRHWLMLSEEASRAGIVVPDQKIEQIIESRDTLLKNQGFPSLEDLRAQHRLSRSRLKRAVARHQAIQENAGRVFGISMPSESQIKHYVRQTEDRVKVKYASLDAAQFVDSTEPISEAEMQAHFDKYKDVLPEESETGFGYRFPRRVTIQYVTASVRDAELRVDVSLDEIKTYWKGRDKEGLLNRDKYKKTITIDDPTATNSAPTSQPAGPPKQITQQVTMAFSEAKPQIEEEIRHKKGVKVARAAMNKLARELARPWNTVRTDKESGYKPVPPAVMAPDFMKSACDRVAADYGIFLNYDMPEPFSKKRLASNPLLSRAKTPGAGNESLNIAEYAFRVKGFYEPKDASDTALRLQMYQTPDAPLVVRSRSNNMTFDPITKRVIAQPGDPETFVLFRVIDARESAPPSNLESVRAQVEKDIRLMHAFAAMESAAQEFYAVASRLGVDEAFNRFADFRTERGLTRISTPAAFSRRVRMSGPDAQEMILAGKLPIEPATVSGIGQSEGFIEASFSLTSEDWAPPAMDLPQTDRVKTATSQPTAEPPKKVCLFSDIKLRKWFIIQLDDYQPVTTTTYDSSFRQRGMSALFSARTTALRDAWYNPRRIEKRCGYVDVYGATIPDSREGLQSPTPEKPAGSSL